MSSVTITYDDMKQYEFILDKVPSLLLGTMIRTNANLVSKFKPAILSKLNKLNEVQEKQLLAILNSDVEDLQKLLALGYKKSGKKQYKQLSQPKAAKFLEKNVKELKKLVVK